MNSNNTNSQQPKQPQPQSGVTNLSGVSIRNGVVNLGNSSNTMGNFTVKNSGTPKTPANIENVVLNDAGSKNKMGDFCVEENK